MCLAARGDDGIAEAETRLLRAMETSGQQDALSFQLRAATGLARVWRNRNRGGEAHTLLSQVYSGFTEGLETPDLKDAKALLDDLET
jgi:predicted ATPase